VKEWTIYLNEITEAAHLNHRTPAFWNNFYRADQSIDWFIRDNEPMFGDIARLQIAAVLLNCERDDRLSDDWYRLLSKRLFPTNPKSFEAGKLSIISFNYDRSFERYFLNVLESQYGLSWPDAKAVFDRIRLEHVYGQLSGLEEVPYGDITKAQRAAKDIRLIRPETDDSMQQKLRILIQGAVYINFIGFGFDEDNIKILGPDNFKGKRVYSTSFGLSHMTRKTAMQKLGVRFHDPKNAPELTAAQLFHTKDLFGPRLKPRAATQPRVIQRPFSTDWKL
jgi:hypothetical protein